MSTSEVVASRRPWSWWLATGAGLGGLRPGPGTWGSLGALLVIGLLILLFPAAWLAPLCLLLALLAALASLGTAPAMVRWSGREDPGFLVVDEMAGLWLGCALLPGPAVLATWPWSLPILFLLFRLLDIAKPWPVSVPDRRGGPWGILLDDLLAGLIAGLAVLPLVLE